MTHERETILNRYLTEFKYLGVVFDDRLSWNVDIKETACNARKRIGMLGRIRKHITFHSANTIYISMIRPILEYCTGVWACCGDVNCAILQNREIGTRTYAPLNSIAILH